MSISTLCRAPEPFDVARIEQAFGLPPLAHGSLPKNRRGKETIYLVEDIGQRLGLHPDMCILDYGCGIGRLSKALIERFGCRVIGVESSQSMHSLAPQFVLSERFSIWSPATLEAMCKRGFRADGAIAVRALAHPGEAASIIDDLAIALLPTAPLYCVESIGELPQQVQASLAQHFEVSQSYSMPSEVETALEPGTSTVQVLKVRTN